MLDGDGDDNEEYACYNLPEFTEQDFAQIDEICQSILGPAIMVEFEEPGRSVEPNNSMKRALSNAARGTKKPSPFQQFRSHNNILSVTDLVGPLWCEVQFDYGLRQKRSSRLENRPDSFTSDAGKTIVVAKDIAAKNEVSLKKGKSVHAKLEREIRPEVITVTASLEEERWALRLINMMGCLEDLNTNRGITREMNVFGIVHNQVVVGVIDEIQRKPIPEVKSEKATRPSESLHTTTPKSKRTRRESLPSQSQSTSPKASETNIRPSNTTSFSPKYTLCLSDTKTRHSRGLPPHDDTLSSRLQLMLYHRLLSDLISQSPLYNFSELWLRLDIDSSRPFSRKFMEEAGLIHTKGHAEGPICLDDLTNVWNESLGSLQVQGVEQELELVYRSRSTKRKKKMEVVGSFVTQEDRDIANAIEASLQDFKSDISEADGHDGTQDNIMTKLSEDPELFWALQRSVLEKISNHGPLVESSADEETSDIIGTKKFVQNDSLLDSHVLSVLEWWHGKRAPIGVSIAQSKRCFTCEYRDDCEWREAKVEEAAQKLMKSRTCSDTANSARP